MVFKHSLCYTKSRIGIAHRYISELCKMKMALSFNFFFIRVCLYIIKSRVKSVCTVLQEHSLWSMYNMQNILYGLPIIKYEIYTPCFPNNYPSSICFLLSLHFQPNGKQSATFHGLWASNEANYWVVHIIWCCPPSYPFCFFHC